MFTGLIEATGRIERIDERPDGRRLECSAPFADELRAGDSIAVNGVCLTAVSITSSGFVVDVGPETQRVTTVGTFAAGRLVNLERPMRADGRLGGHVVLGHVDGIGRIVAQRDAGENRWLDVELPADLRSLVVLKGSIAIDGISLTIAALDGDCVRIQLIPFTLASTALRDARVGDAVNIEADVIGKYVARLVGAHVEALTGHAGAART